MGKNSIHQEFIQDDVNEYNLFNAYEKLNYDKFLQNASILRNYLQIN